jgi:hypothetical protein
MLALEREGVQCELDVGASEFRVPLAVIDRTDPNRYRLGLMFVDGDNAESPIEAHLHVPAVLGQRGWKVVRINARDWNRQPREVIELIRREIAA